MQINPIKNRKANARKVKTINIINTLKQNKKTVAKKTKTKFNKPKLKIYMPKKSKN